MALTAGDVVNRIKTNLGVPWRETTYRDTFKFGGPETEIKGIATSMFCTFKVVQQAAAAGLNMIIPHEDTYWNDRDNTSVVDGDPVYAAKADFMRQHNIVVFRMHDHMHAQRPDFIYVGAARALGLDSKYETAPQSHRFVIPETTLGALAADFQRRLGLKALRAVGDPKARVSRIQLGVGYAPEWTDLTSMSSSVGNSRKQMGCSTARSTCSMPLRWAFRRAGLCWAMRFRKNRACSKWRSG